ncbi:MAG: hypothetical protein KatS3mg060_3377 [Dehalococcoidia bacterium]|nr:MAG: hypothetical protein KatS3mg060_3377 [Dehalococcoidia bacterium]
MRWRGGRGAGCSTDSVGFLDCRQRGSTGLLLRLAGGGPLGVAAGRLTPGVRTVVVIACGLAAMPLRRFVLGIVIGSGLFFSLHAALGFVAGPPIVAAVQGLNLPIVPLLLVNAFAGLVFWLLRRRRAAPAALAWVDAGCPACAVAGLVLRDPALGDGVAAQAAA